MRTLLFLALLVISSGLLAQNTIPAAGTLYDSDQQPWISATWSLVPVAPSGARVVYIDGTAATPTSGQVDASGVFASGAVPLTSRMQPAGSTLTATLCSVTSAPCTVISGIATTPASNIGTILSARLPAPRIPAAALIYAYSAGEILNPTSGKGYINTATGSQYIGVGSGALFQWVRIGAPIYPPAGVAVSTGTAWGTSIDPATLPRLNTGNNFTGINIFGAGVAFYYDVSFAAKAYFNGTTYLGGSTPATIVQPGGALDSPAITVASVPVCLSNGTNCPASVLTGTPSTKPGTTPAPNKKPR